MQPMKNPTWPKAMAFIGFAIFGLALAYYSTAIASAGVAARLLGSDRSGDWLTTGSAVLMVGIAAAAAFSFLAVTNVRALMRRRG
jgi:threonine/homoserine/homoserine lactone efflux protein